MIRVPNWPFSEANFFIKNVISVDNFTEIWSCAKLISDKLVLTLWHSLVNFKKKHTFYFWYIHNIIINYTALPGSSVCAKDKVSAKKVRSKDKVLDLYLKNSLLLTTTTRRVLNHRLTLTAANLYILTSKNKNTLQFPTETYYYYINFCLVSS